MTQNNKDRLISYKKKRKKKKEERERKKRKLETVYETMVFTMLDSS